MKVGADFNLLGAATNLARLAILGLRFSPTAKWATTTCHTRTGKSPPPPDQPTDQPTPTSTAFDRPHHIGATHTGRREDLDDANTSRVGPHSPRFTPAT
jgi:hypothetical protein